MALGNDVPNVLRHNLNVLSEEEWAAKKDQFVYESWVRQALAAEGQEANSPATPQSPEKK